jgi:hypothetical protein
MGMRITLMALGTLVVTACGGSVGSGGNTDGRTPEELVNEFCADAVRVPCNEDLGTEAECRQSADEARDEAVLEGCGSQFDAVLRCATSQRPACLRDIEQICSAEISQLEECQNATGGGSGGDEACGIFYGPGESGVSCGVNCPSYASSCSGPSQFGPLACSCTEGPKVGMTFSASDCSAGVASSSEASCR